MAVLNQALAAQGQQPPQQPAPPQMDPVAMLMEEYQRLAPDEGPAKPMFTPEQANERIDRNDSLANLGVLGSLSGDRGINHVGAQVFKQALGDRAERRTDRGIVDPLAGTETLDPEYVRSQREQRRGQVLQRALAYQQSRENSLDRTSASADRNATLQAIAAGHDDTRRAIKSMGGGEGNHNLVQVKDDVTGQSFWADPRTGQPVKPVTGLDNKPIVRPDKPSGGDEKELTAISTGKAAAAMAIEAVTKHPDAFGPIKGAPDLMGQGMAGAAMRYVRDNKSLTPDQIAARSIIYNNVSAIIKERAGTAQSAQELKRLQGFLPSELDNGPAILAKMKAFDAFLNEKGIAVRNKYAGPRPMQHMGGTVPTVDPNANAAPTTGAPPVKRLVFNPATGELE